MNDFSTVTTRKNTGSLKWAQTEQAGYEAAYPFSVADMEFCAPDEIKKACAAFALNGFYTYTVADDKYLSAVCDFMKRRHNWEIQKDWITTTYGIVSAIHTAVRSYTNEGDGVIVQQPVYAHFMGAVELNRRRVVNNALVIKNGRYEMNFEELEFLCRRDENKMLILCSPHNPVGRVWTREELYKVYEICSKHNVIVVSDEIHFDIVRKPHTVFAHLCEGAKNITVTCTAASKSFNIAGLGTSQIMIADKTLREKFQQRVAKDGYECINCFAYPALIAAYTQCDNWLDEMNRKVQENFEYMKEFLQNNLPMIKTFDLEGTYLAWLDVSALHIPDENAVEVFGKKAGLIPNYGGWFGESGKGYIRLNIAVPKSELIRGLERLKNAVENGLL